MDADMMYGATAIFLNVLGFFFLGLFLVPAAIVLGLIVFNRSALGKVAVFLGVIQLIIFIIL
jgi:hypothetical protein